MSPQGRPPKPQKELLSVRQQVRVSNEEKIAFAAASHEAGFSTVSAWAREILRHGAIDANRHLLKLVDELNSLNEPANSSLRGKDDLEVARQACKLYCGVVSPCCWVAYYWNRMLNQVEILCHENFLYPQALHDFHRKDDLPRQSIFAPSELLLTDVTDEERQSRSLYHRENVSVAFRSLLRWNMARLAIFMYRRTDCAHSIIRRGEEDRLRPMTHYFHGWLSSQGYQLIGNRLDTRLDPRLVMINTRDLFGNVHHPQSFTRELCDLVFDVVKERGVNTEVQVHWFETQGVGTSITPSPTSPAESRPKNSAPIEYQNGDFQHSKTVELLAAKWKTPIFIKDIDGSNQSDRWRELCALNNNPEHNHLPTKCLLANPMRDSAGNVIGVVTVRTDQAKKLDRGRLLCVALISNLIAKLLEIAPKRGDTEQESELINGSTLSAEGFVWSLINKASELTNEEDILSRFTDWILRRVGADLVYVLTYDHDADRFHPGGICKSRKLTDRLSDSNHIDSELNRIISGPGLGQFLVPRRYGRSWEIYRSGQPKVAWPTAEEQQPAGRLSREHFKTLLGIPFRHSDEAQPEGVIWIRWIDTPGQLVLGDSCSGLEDQYHSLASGTNDRSALRETIKRHILDQCQEQIVHAAEPVAAICTLFEALSAKQT